MIEKEVQLINFENLVERFYDEYAKTKINYYRHKIIENEKSLFQIFLFLMVMILIVGNMIVLVPLIHSIINESEIMIYINLLIAINIFLIFLMFIPMMIIYIIRKFSKKKTILEWLIVELKNFSFIRDTLLYKKKTFNWAELSQVKIETIEKRSYHDESHLKYFLILNFANREKPIKIYIGKDIGWHFSEIIKDFFKFLKFINTSSSNLDVSSLLLEKPLIIKAKNNQEVSLPNEIFDDFYENVIDTNIEELREKVQPKLTLFRHLIALQIISIGAILAVIYYLIDESLIIISFCIFGFFLGLYIVANGLYFIDKKRSNKEWVLHKLKQFNAFQEIIYNRHNLFDWINMESVEILEDKSLKKGSKPIKDIHIRYYLLLFYNNQIKPLKINLGTHRKKELIELIRVFFEYVRLLINGCPNCGVMLKIYNQKLCKNCNYELF